MSHWHGHDWQTWQPREKATLTLIQRDQKMLLIRKKRGLGAGLITGPGGRLDPGENLWHCARRELKEEVQLEAQNLDPVGLLRFQFTSGYSLWVAVFSGQALGEPHETEEALPLWFPTADLPYDQMWADDRYWLPLVLAHKPFCASFVFCGKSMLTLDLKTVTKAQLLEQIGRRSA